MKPIIFALSAAAGFSSLGLTAGAATYTVTNTANAGAGSLRDAVNLANTNPGADTIVFDTAGVFSTAQTITLGGGQIQITGALTIQGPAGDTRRVSIDGDNQSRIFLVDLPGSGTVSLQRLDMERGNSADDGGAIRNNSPATSTLELVDCYIFNSNARHGGGVDAGAASLILTDTSVNYNDATGRGGGLISTGVVTMTRGELRQNDAQGDGGGWWMNGGNATLTDADIVVNFAARGAGIHMSDGASLSVTNGSISSNRSTDAGGGIRAVGASSVNLRRVRVGDNHASVGGGMALRMSSLVATNTLFVVNVATGEGGGIRFSPGSTGVLKNCTVSGNDGASEHAGLSVDTASVSLGNTVVAENPTYGEDDMSGSFFSLGHNLIGYLGTATGFSNGIDGDIVGGENGAPRVESDLNSGAATFAPMERSRCLEAGDPLLVSGPDYGSAPLLDAVDSPRIRGVVDIGAIERDLNAIITNTNDSGPGSLRAALALTPTDIAFDASFFGTTLRTVTLTTGQITLSSNISIVGPAPGVRISGNNASRVFNVTAGAVSLKRVRVIDGAATGDGGGIRVINAGTSLALDDAGVSNSTATGRGGGLYVQDASTLSVTNSTFSNNAADGDGGGIHVNGATANITNSTISTNTSKSGGGGVYAGGTGTTTLINCTVADNTCDSDAGGAVGNGGGLRRNAGTLTVGNTIIARNTDASASVIHPDASGTFVSLGHNLVGKIEGVDAAGTPFQNGVNGDLAGTIASPLAPGLNALQQNPASSPTRVHPLQAGSPARDAGAGSLLTHTAWPSTPVGSDQRGQFREVGTRVDIGAVEYPDGNVAKVSVEATAVSEFLLQRTQVKFRRSYDDGASLVVNVTTAGSTAAAGDYVLSGASYTPTGADTFTVTIPAGSTSVFLNLTPTNDAIAEGLETVSFGLAAGAGYQLDSGDPATQSVFIYDDEYLVTSPAGSGPGSLREAIQQANIAGGAQITIAGDLTIPLGGSQLVVNADIDIVATHAVLDGQGLSRVLWIDDGSSEASLTGIELVRGTGVGGSFTGGGALFVDGYCDVTLNDCRLRDSSSTSSGGGLHAYSGSSVTLRDCAIVDNSASGGGGIYGGSATLNLINVTVAGNTTTTYGGGVSVIGGSLTQEGCTLTENTADSNAFGIYGGGGLYAAGVNLILNNTVIAGNNDPGASGPGAQFAPDVWDSGANWLGAFRNCIGINSGVSAQFPALSPGPGGNHAGSASSPINPLLFRVDAPRTSYYDFEYSSVLRDNGANLAASTLTDQRGYGRIFNGTVDIGAVEMDFFQVTNANSSGAGSLRQALSSAQAAGHGTIVFSPTFFNTPRTIVTGGTEYSTSASVVIWGPSSASARLTLSGEDALRVLNISGLGKTVDLRNLDIIDGNTSSNAAGNRAGAGLLVGGTSLAILRHCVVRDCTALTEGGGATVFNGAQLTAFDSTFAGNASGLGGGGISNSGTLTLERVTLSDNATTTTGGGLSNNGTATLTNATLSGNRANSHGGGIDTSGNLTLIHCTLTQNRANNNNSGGENAGGIRVLSGTASVRASLITGNDALGGSQDDITGSFTSLGHNLVGTTTGGSGFTHGTNGDLVGSQASLGPLDNNGGFTLTHALGAASAAVNAAGLAATPADQRGLPRTGFADIGAFELRQESYAYWAAHEFTSLGNTAATSDYDGDGFLNGYEYATGSDATDPLSIPEMSVTIVNNQWHLTTAVSPSFVTGSLVAQSSANLLSWSNLPPASFSPAGFSQSGKNLLIRISFDFAADRTFARITYLP